MLLTQEQLKKLKKTNVSKDADKTKERVELDFKGASRAEKKAAVALTGQQTNTFYRVFNTGIIGARVVLALAQTLNVSPFYYTGETDERGSIDGEVIRQFLEGLGYKSLLKELDVAPPKRKYTRKPKEEALAETPVQEETPVEEPQVLVEAPEECADADMEDALEVTLLFSDEPDMKKAIEELSETEAVELLHTLFIRAKGGSDAKFLADVVKRCLLK